jgi:hypothetical protein
MNAKPQYAGLVPSGILKRLRPEDIAPSRNNPRLLFDPEPLHVLKENIRVHGVLVPITVFKIAAQEKYQILDGERRYRCCVELEKELKKPFLIPANIVEPPDKTARLLYMFSIHNIREAWELMPVALSLGEIIDLLGVSDTNTLKDLTGLSEPQIERCKILLEYPVKFQRMSLNPDPEKRVPANLWIEGHPVIDLIHELLPKKFRELGKAGIAEIWAQKYDLGAIKSVLHFRRILEGAEQAEEDGRLDEFRARLGEYLDNIELETRICFDGFAAEARKISAAKLACEDFMRALNRAKVEHLLERDDVFNQLKEVQAFIENLLDKLKYEDSPESKRKQIKK